MKNKESSQKKQNGLKDIKEIVITIRKDPEAVKQANEILATC